MNLAKSKVVLKKINNLYDNLELSDDISRIEKDLLQDYVKELYELVLEIGTKEGKSKKDKNKKKASVVPSVQKIVEEPRVETPKVKNKEPKIEIDTPDEVTVEYDLVEQNLEEVMSTIDPLPQPTTNGVHHIQEAIAPVTPVAPVSSVKKIAPEIEGLFDSSIIDQVDYRFSQTPITDVTKAMGINERMLVVNLLFNKDQQDFNYITSKLNYFATFEEAANYLKTEVAGKYDWATVDKKDKAIEFIKLVKRKYA